MKTQLTAEESAKLIELGVSPGKANGLWLPGTDAIIPFTLADILDILPRSIEHNGYAEAKLNIYTRPHRRECWVAKYIVSAKTIPYDGASDELIDALYEVLYKLLDNHVKLT